MLLLFDALNHLSILRIIKQAMGIIIQYWRIIIPAIFFTQEAYIYLKFKIDENL